MAITALVPVGFSMKLTTFAQKYGLRLSKDEVGEPIVYGIYGDISECSDKLLVACFWGPRQSKARTIRIRESVEKGCGRPVSYTPGSEECLFWFDPGNKSHSKWFISKLQCQKVKHLTDEERRVLAERLKVARTVKKEGTKAKTKRAPRHSKEAKRLQPSLF